MYQMNDSVMKIKKVTEIINASIIMVKIQFNSFFFSLMFSRADDNLEFDRDFFKTQSGNF